MERVRSKFQYHSESRYNVPASKKLADVSATLGGGQHSLAGLGAARAS